MRLLLDEHFSPQIAESLRARGHDVRAVAASELSGLADRMVVSTARDQGRAVVTENIADFLAITVELAHVGAHHPGVILTTDRRFPRSRRGFGLLVEALDALLVAYPDPDALTDRVIWLDRPKSKADTAT